MRNPKDEDEHPKTRVKFVQVDGNRVYRGKLEEGEAWNGGIEELLIGFSFEKEYIYRYPGGGTTVGARFAPFRALESPRG